MTTQIKAGVIAANAITASELASSALSGGSFTGDVTFNTNTLVVDSTNNRVGIGTSSPGVSLHVKTDSEHQIKIESTASAGASMQLYSGGSYSYTVYEHPTANFRIGAYGGSSFIIRDHANSADRLVIDSSGNVGIGTSSTTSLLTLGTGTFSAAATNTSALYTSATDGMVALADGFLWGTRGGADRMKIDSSGNVGIGKTPNRSRKLEVAGDINLDNGYGLEWEDGGVGIVGSGATDVMTFSTAGVERMRVHSSGDISIGSSGTIYKNISAAQSPTLSIDGTFPAINFKDDSGTAAFYGINGSRLYLGGNTSTVDLLFYLNDAAVTKITDAGIVSTTCSTNYKGVHIHGSQAPCITFAKNTTDETSPEWRIGVSGYDGADLAISLGSTTGDRVRIDPNGRLLAGVENVAPRAGNTNVGNEAIQSYGPIISGAFQGSYTGGLHCIRDWFVYAGPSTNTGAYLHIKTDLANSTANSAYTMSFFKYRAYCYGGGGNVAEGLLGWHNWSGGYYNVGVINYNSSWALVQSSYTSSDNYVVLVAYLAASYCHLAIDWDQWGGYAFRTAKVVSTTQSNSSTGAY